MGIVRKKVVQGGGVGKSFDLKKQKKTKSMSHVKSDFRREDSGGKNPKLNKIPLFMNLQFNKGRVKRATGWQKSEGKMFKIFNLMEESHVSRISSELNSLRVHTSHNRSIQEIVNHFFIYFSKFVENGYTNGFIYWIEEMHNEVPYGFCNGYHDKNWSGLGDPELFCVSSVFDNSTETEEPYKIKITLFSGGI
tara:strand:+ start:53 stop:631 length:579 start_codon:yes stop_codon:yes gene_type:complete